MADLPSFLNFTRRKRTAAPVNAGDDDRGGWGSGAGGRAGDSLDTSDAPVTKLPGATTVTNAAPAPAPRVNPALNIDPNAVEPAPTASIGETVPIPVTPPAVTPVERRGAGPLPLQHNARGETVGKPVYDDTGDRGADLETYRQGLANQRNPEDRDGKLKTFFKEFGQGLLEGGLFGGIARGVRGLAAPNVNERRARDREIARVEGEQGKVRAEQGWQAKLSEAQADLDLKHAQKKKLDVETEELPKQNEAARDAKSQTRLLSQLRAVGRYKRGENVALDKKLDDAGMSVSDFEKGGKFQWHEAGGQVYTMDMGTGKVDYATVGGSSVQDKSKMPGADGLTPAQAALAKFRTTALYEQIKQKEKDRSSREGIAARAQEGANSRSSAAQAGADRRSLAGKRFSLLTLANNLKNGQTLDELVKEVQGLGGDVFDDEK